MNSSKTLICTHCDKAYNHIQSLKRHLLKFHSETISRNKESYKYSCILCEKKFKHRQNLTRHERQAHGIANYRNTLKCTLCNFSTSLKKDFFDHIQSVHRIPIEFEEYSFDSFNDFKDWLDNIEKETFARYKKNSGCCSGANNTKRHYFICHRSGSFVPNVNNKKNLKKQGSKKINGTCPSSIQVHEAEDGTCMVSYIKTHVGHENDICHLTLTREERQTIAEAIADKIPFDEILHTIRDSVTDSTMERVHFLTRKDLYNIEHEFNLTSDAVRHSDDRKNIEAWVTEDKASSHPCVLFYKPEGHEYPDLEADDFVLVIMSNAQAEFLKQHGSNFVCVDEIYRLNSNRFKLTYVVVLDELEQPFPCAFLISNHTNQSVLEIFFEVIKSETDVVVPNTFMCSFEETCLDVWVSVMGEPGRRIDRNLNKNLYVERIKKTLEYMYLHGKNGFHVDKAIHRLMTFVEDKMFDRSIVLKKVKVGSKIKAINKRHELSLKLKIDTIIKKGNSWVIPSASTVNKGMFEVQESSMKCQCELVCSECNVCMHTYTCTCFDSCIKGNMCKHVHLIARYRLQELGDGKVNNESINSQENDNNFFYYVCEDQPYEVDTIVQEITVSTSEDLISEKKEELKSKFQNLLESVQNENEIEVLSKGYEELEATLSAVRSKHKNIPESSNKHKIQPQRRPRKKVKQDVQDVISISNVVEVEPITLAMLLGQHQTEEMQITIE